MWASPQVPPAGEPDSEPDLECSFETKDCPRKAHASSVLRGQPSGGGGHPPEVRPRRGRCGLPDGLPETSCPVALELEKSPLEHLESSVRNLNYVRFKLKETFTIWYNKESEGDRVPGQPPGSPLSGKK